MSENEDLSLVTLFAEKVGNGPPLLVLHGLFGSSDNWRTVLRPLTDEYTVWFIDLRNHGRSPHTSTHGYPEMVADVLALMDQHGLAQATVLGHSMGGKVAASLALQNPERVRRLVVVDMGLKANPMSHAPQFEAMRAVDLTQATDRRTADAHMAQHEPDHTVRQFLMKSLARHPEGGWHWRLNLDTLQRDYARILAAVAPGKLPYPGPALFMRGEYSGYLPDADWPQVLQLFPQAQLTTVAGAGHWLHAEQPAAFMAQLTAFLRQTA